MLLSQSFNRALDCVEIDVLRMIHGTLLYQQGAHGRGRGDDGAGRRGRRGCGSKSRTLGRGEPQAKKPRMENHQALDEEDGLKSLKLDIQSGECSDLISYFFDVINQ